MSMGQKSLRIHKNRERAGIGAQKSCEFEDMKQVDKILERDDASSYVDDDY